MEIIFKIEVIEKLLGARASRPHVQTKYGRKPAFPAKPKCFSITAVFKDLKNEE